MKLATLNKDGQDGRLLIVSPDLTTAVEADAAHTLLAALGSWSLVGPLLRTQAALLATGMAREAFSFDPARILAPLPRAPQWLDASAFRTHSELVAAAWQTANRWNDQAPLMYQGASDDLLPAQGPSYLPDETHDIDFEGEVAVVVDDVPMGVTADAALGHIQLVMIANDVSLRAFGSREQEAGFGFLQAKPSTVFSPVAVTPDELGSAWQGGRLHRPVNVRVNGDWVGSPNATHMSFNFGQLIAHAARSRRLRAGTIVGSGTVSDPDRATGSATLVEVRAIEKALHGAPRTPFLKFGDRVEIEVLDDQGRTIFGAINHQVLRQI